MPADTRTASILAVLTLCAAAVVAAPTPAPASLDRFKALAGDWVAAADGPMVKKGDLVARYVVTSSGTAVVETVFPGSPHEMVTVYHADGPDLVLAHYCMSGNQPRMRAKAPQGQSVDFVYDGGLGIEPASTRHMNSASFDFAGQDEIRTKWTEIEKGKTVFVASMHLVRKAR